MLGQIKNLLKARPLFFGMGAILFLSNVSFAQESRQKRRVEEEKRNILDQLPAQTLHETQKILYEYGAWFNYRFTNFNNDDNDRSRDDALDEKSSWDNRLWFKAAFRPRGAENPSREHLLYVRLKNVYDERSGVRPGARFDYNGPHLDYGYLVFNFSPVWVELGRRYFNLGKGIAYSDVNDGIQINFKKPRWNIGLLLSQTLPHEDNIDLSIPGALKKSDRKFFGLGVGYAGIRHHQVYGFTLAQKDESNEEPPDPDHEYTYNSQYFGLGSRGTWGKYFDYWIELIKENGTSRVFGTNEKKKVDAYSIDSEVNYSLSLYSHPRFTFEYALGSGDKDRESVTDTEFGNSQGKDRSFLYFGYLPTGYSLSPRLSNLYLYRTGLKFYPLEKYRSLRNLSFEFNYFRFFKHQAAGGISDLEATQNSRDIGQELDTRFSWQILSDIGVTIDYGHFAPGDAYAQRANDTQEYFSVSVTHTF